MARRCIVALLAAICFSAFGDEPDCDPDRFVLRSYQKQLSEKSADDQPENVPPFPVFAGGVVSQKLKLVADVTPKQAGHAEARIDSGSHAVCRFEPSSTGARAEFRFVTTDSQSLNLRAYRNGEIEFTIRGPRHADARFLMHADGGMYVYGQTVAQNLLLTGEWQTISLPMRFFDRMIAPGASYVVPMEYEKVTSPFAIDLFAKQESIIEIKSVLIRSQVKQPLGDQTIRIWFDRPINDWDGFGVNYVESSRSRNYREEPEDYSGFTSLSAKKKEEVLDLVFGENGLRPALLKMFQTPLHEKRFSGSLNPNNIEYEFDHETTTGQMRYFATEGYKRLKQQGLDLTVIVGLYGLPAWATKQRFVRGRDPDPQRFPELAEYVVSWVKFLKTVEHLPVKYASIHNEGDSPNRWDDEGKTPGKLSHDHNAYWQPEAVVGFVKILDKALKEHGLADVSVTPGEYSTWQKFYAPGHERDYYAKELFQDREALQSIGLLTSHSFWNPTDEGKNLIRLKRPDLHAWTTSVSWNWGRQSDVSYLDFIRREIYDVKVNGLINWAICFAPSKWVGDYPNPGTGIFISDGDYRVEPAYHYYKQLCQAGRKGTKVAQAISQVPRVNVLAFAGGGNGQPDSFIVYNMNESKRSVTIDLSASQHDRFEATMNRNCEYETPLGIIATVNGKIELELKPYSSVVFMGRSR